MTVVEREAPDILVLAPAERQMFCFGGRAGILTGVPYRTNSPVVMSNIWDHDGRVPREGKYLIRILKSCNTYPEGIRCACDQDFQGEIRRDDPWGPHGSEGFSGKSRQGRSPKTDYGGRSYLS